DDRELPPRLAERRSGHRLLPMDLGKWPRDTGLLRPLPPEHRWRDPAGHRRRGTGHRRYRRPAETETEKVTAAMGASCRPVPGRGKPQLSDAYLRAPVGIATRARSF